MSELGNGLGPLGISWVISFLALLIGTVVGGVVLALGQLAMRGGKPEAMPLAGSAFGGTAMGLFVFSLSWWLLDNTTKPAASAPLILSALAGGLLSLFVSSKRLDVPARFLVLAWAPFGIVLTLLLIGTGLTISGWREQSGFFRGFERTHSYNMIDPRDAMATPTAAVKFYNQQYGLLRTANEDRGWGNILTTQSRFDAKWFLENDQWINEHNSRSDVTGISKVIQDPRAIRVMALSRLARPVFGEPVEEQILGDEALVRTDEGQVVRLIKEGPHWKIYGWLGHRFAIMEEIYPTKKEKNGLTTGDELEAAGGWSSYETEAEELAQRAGMSYIPSSSFAEESQEDPEQVGRPVARGGLIRKKSRTGYARLDLAPPGTLVDLTRDEKVEYIEVPAPSRGTAATRRAGVTGTDGASGTNQVSQTISPTPAPQVAALPATPTPAASAPVSTPASTPVPVAASTPAPVVAQPTAPPAPQPTNPVPGVTGALTPLPGLPGIPLGEATPVPEGMPLISGLFSGPTNSSASLPNFWAIYFQAVEGIQRNDPAAVRTFLALLSMDDRTWIQRNGRLICLLITPEAMQWSEDRITLITCQILLRNMPRLPVPEGRMRMWQNQSTALVRMVERTDGQPDRVYTTLLIQERGQWVLVHPFWVRTLIWTPQLTESKRAFNLPLALDELSYAQSGLAPMQAFIRGVYRDLGYKPD